MRKLILIIVVFIATFSKGHSQGIVVNDPANLSVNVAMQSLNQAMTTISTYMAMAEKLQLAADAFNQVATIAEIMEYIDELACLTTEMRFNLQIANNYSCLTALNFRSVNLSIRYASEIIMKVFLTANLFTMTSSARLQSLNDIVDILRELVGTMSKFNTGVRMYNRKKITQNFIRQNIYNPTTGFFISRYHKK